MPPVPPVPPVPSVLVPGPMIDSGAEQAARVMDVRENRVSTAFEDMRMRTSCIE
jgi:hypothetical protein